MEEWHKKNQIGKVLIRTFSKVTKTTSPLGLCLPNVSKLPNLAPFETRLNSHSDTDIELTCFFFSNSAVFWAKCYATFQHCYIDKIERRVTLAENFDWGFNRIFNLG